MTESVDGRAYLLPGHLMRLCLVFSSQAVQLVFNPTATSHSSHNYVQFNPQMPLQLLPCSAGIEIWPKV